MFCSSCGQPISEGKAFCRYCGAQVTAVAPPAGPPADDSPTAEGPLDDFPTAETPIDQAATVVRAPDWSDARTVVVPDPSEMATTVLPPDAHEAQTAEVSAVLPAVAEVKHMVPPPVTGAGAPYISSAGAAPAAEHTAIRSKGAYPPDRLAYLDDEPAPRRSGRGLIAAFIIAVVIIAAAAAAATILLVSDDGGGSAGTTIPVGTTVAPGTTTTLAPETSTTVPDTSSTDTTEASTTSSEPTGTSVSGEHYLTILGALAGMLADDDARIPELAKQINSTAPAVPQSVTTELKNMLEDLNSAVHDLSALYTPPAFTEADALLKKAAGYMRDRIQATIDGVEAYRDGDDAAATAYFREGQTARDEFRATYEQYQLVQPNA